MYNMQKIERLRQTGKTTRIANFVIDQLHSVGEVIVTDHSSFEFPESNVTSSLQLLIDKVEKLDAANSPGNREIEHEFVEVGGIKLIRFKLRFKYDKTLNV